MRALVFAPAHDWPMLRVATLEAERAGFDGVLVGDHIWMLGRPRLEALSTVGALAAITTRITLGLGVLSPSFRAPAVTARAIATLYDVSGGRLRAGVGAGADEAEHQRADIPFGSPGDRLRQMERTIRAIKDACNDVPIVIGASGDRALELVARYADEWNCGAMYLDRIDDRVRRVTALTAHRERPLLRTVNMPIQLGPSQDEAVARRSNLHLALHGDVEAMTRRLREIRGLGFDGVWLGAQAPGAFERALELLPRIKEL